MARVPAPERASAPAWRDQLELVAAVREPAPPRQLRALARRITALVTLSAAAAPAPRSDMERGADRDPLLPETDGRTGGQPRRRAGGLTPARAATPISALVGAAV
jgi:hypothetical protein